MRKTGKPFVKIYADGACSGNPGIGGYGIILRSGSKERELSGCHPMTTNNRMELTAVIKGLEELKRPCRVEVVTDSQYVVQGITSWIFNWLKNEWRNSKKQSVINRDLWERLLNLSQLHDIQWIWIQGHSENVENERCDKLAKHAIKMCKKNSRS